MIGFWKTRDGNSERAVVGLFRRPFDKTRDGFVFQIDPFRTSSGTDSTSYVAPSTAGYSTETFGANTMDDKQLLSNQVVWQYNSQSCLTLFSPWRFQRPTATR